MKLDNTHITYNHIFKHLNIFVVAIDNQGVIVDAQGEYALLGLKQMPRTSQSLQQLFSVNTYSIIHQVLNQYFREGTEVKQEIHLPPKGFFELQIHADQGLHFLTFTKKKQVIPNEEAQQYEKVIQCYESRYRSFFETDPVMHVGIDPINGQIVDCNQMIVSRLGYTSKADIIGQPVYSLFTPEKKAKCLSLVDKFKAQGFLIKEEMELMTTQGVVIPILLYTTAERDEQGNILYSRSTLVDVSDLKKAEAKLQKKRAYLELLNNQLEYFMLTCSHDLKEPLGTIKLSADVILKLYKRQLPAQARKYLSYIDESVDRMNEQISLLLSHAKLGRMSDKSLVSIQELITVVLDDLGASINQSKAKIQLPEALPEMEIYQTEFRLLFQNLLSNAIKYVAPGVTPEIEITHTEKIDVHQFEVIDNGIGIAQEDISRIFQIFNDVYSDNPNKGSGIGLSHCKKIVELHGGMIHVVSEVGKGTRFVFTIAK